jgi:succinate dehydrogenase/fumarate reductase cytochrome b subunit
MIESPTRPPGNSSVLISRAPYFRYGIALASFAGAFLLVFLFQRMQVRDPFALVFLAAVAVSAWYGGPGPGILAFVLSALALNIFLHVPGGWRLFSRYGSIFALSPIDQNQLEDKS